MQNQSNGYKWYILALVVLTNMFVIAMPAMGMAVLAREISQDLEMNIVQEVGVVWGIGSMPAIFTSLLGGGIGDKLGPKRVLIAGSLVPLPATRRCVDLLCLKTNSQAFQSRGVGYDRL